MIQKEAIPKLITIETNKEIIPGFSISPFLVDAKDTTEKTPFWFRFQVDSKFHINKHDVVKVFDRFMLLRDGSIYYSNHILPKIMLNLVFRPNTNEIQVNPTYFLLVKEKIGSAYPPGVLLLDYVFVELLVRNFFVLHASGISDNDGAYLFIAPPNTGKTTTVLQFLNNHKNLLYVGEDTVIIDAKRNFVYPTPHTSTFFHHETRFGHIEGLFRVKYKPTGRSLFRGRILDTPQNISSIFLLQKGIDDKIIPLEDVDHRYIMKILLSIQRYEFSWFKNPLLRASSFLLDDWYNLDELLNKEEELLWKLLKRNQVFLVRSSNSFRFYNIIRDHLDIKP
ncbi:hypothetical protein, containing ATP/GTP-binding site motif A [Thermococcus kodakarensis KOD1]|uniref:Uncharacterized protein n=1 Tax=Thermococcus kodakarensis (strain ATCC BAA-918 / JCM 12380 / KOD1) TaxID=69014 RepID=Q5JJ20_THEKO|nr:hypothetical protein [Thermococcus kodakarensis]WCN27641.1 hypothetical protein POG15_08795 [Thermococcus kodakarensis]WCN29932.1 hypothetical protein POG21_08780 [Thermococcus kodakarensis]BAD85913.1 hypothetical protein, containing ATP/GTP-binding site motif A [Thermococcus kodakarensis KOD1]